MTSTFAIALGLLAQAAAPVQTRRADVPPVRVWLPDSVLSPGDPARVYVTVRDTSRLVVLHVDASGRIRVLFPRDPGEPDLVPGGEIFAVGGPEDGLTFRVPNPGVGTILAVRAAARTPFRFDELTDDGRWDYAHALLLQPTAGNPYAALLDIADRIADGEGYSYDVAQYRTPGAVAARTTSPDSVCFSCLAARHSGSRAATGGYGEIDNSAVAIDHSYAATNGGEVVDCSDATLVDSFCGVQDNSVSTTVEENTTTYETPSYGYPLYDSFFIPFRRFRRVHRPRTPPLPPPAIALNLRRLAGHPAPPPQRRPPRIVVPQPVAPSHPITAPSPAPGPAQVAPAPAGPPAARTRIVVPAGARQRDAAAGAAWAPAPMPARLVAPSRAPQPATVAPPPGRAATATAAPVRVVGGRAIARQR